VLPSGKDLDEHLLDFQSQQRHPAFQKLIAQRSCTLQSYTEQLEKAQAEKDGGAITAPGQESGQDQEQDPEHERHPIQPEQPETCSGHDDDNSVTERAEHTEHTEEIVNADHPSGDTPGTEDAEDVETAEIQDATTDEQAEEETEEESDPQGHTSGKDPRRIDHQDTDAAGDQPTDDGLQYTKDTKDTKDTATSGSLADHVTMSQIPGEQFYRHDIEMPEELTDPETALGGKNAASPGPDETEEKDPWYKRLGAYLGQGAITLLGRAARSTLKLTLVFAAVYLSLVILLGQLTAGGAFEGMWKWIALGVIVCAILRTRLRHKTSRFIEGKYSPGAKGS
jgi:hypothetical protein